MSLLDRIRTCRHWDPEAYRPFVVSGRRMGRVTRDFAWRLADFPAVFRVGEEAVVLNEALADFDSRTAAVHEVLLALRAAGDLPIWRDEAYPVLRAWDEAPVMKMERGAVPLFGVRGFGVHLNGLVAKPDGLHLWVARRALSKPTAPGKLDHIVAGGQPHGLGIRDNLIKECAEEAGLKAALAERAEAVGMISYVCERPEGLRDDVLFVYDLMLPESFQPSNADGEVEAFFLWPIERVRAVIAEGEEFKFNCALAIIDLLVRRGLITPDDADYQAIVHGLRSSE